MKSVRTSSGGSGSNTSSSSSSSGGGNVGDAVILPSAYTHNHRHHHQTSLLSRPMLTSGERERTMRTYRNLKTQIQRFENDYKERNGKVPKSSWERSAMASNYEHYRILKRTIRADAACRIQATFRGAHQRWKITKREFDDISNPAHISAQLVAAGWESNNKTASDWMSDLIPAQDGAQIVATTSTACSPPYPPTGDVLNLDVEASTPSCLQKTIPPIQTYDGLGTDAFTGGSTITSRTSFPPVWQELPPTYEPTIVVMSEMHIASRNSIPGEIGCVEQPHDSEDQERTLPTTNSVPHDPGHVSTADVEENSHRPHDEENRVHQMGATSVENDSDDADDFKIDYSTISLSALKAWKREVKHELKKFLSDFREEHGRVPEKKDKEQIRHLYVIYGSLKNHIGRREIDEIQQQPTKFDMSPQSYSRFGTACRLFALRRNSRSTPDMGGKATKASGNVTYRTQPSTVCGPPSDIGRQG